MYTNPFALKPGEKLTPQELFERFLDWSNYAQSVEAWKCQPTCDDDLHGSWLCCEDHVRYSLEKHHFDHYFIHFFMMNPLEPGFSLRSMAKVINRHKLRINQEIKEKLRTYWGADAELLFLYLGI